MKFTFRFVLLFVHFSLFAISSVESYNINKGLHLSRGYQVDTITLLSPSWYVSLEIKPFYTVNEWSNVVHFIANDEDISQLGSRVPAIFFIANTRRLHICNPVGSNPNHCFDTTELPLDEYSMVRISQEQSVTALGKVSGVGKFVLRIEVNGQLVHEVVNTLPRFFGNVKVYRSDPWYPVANAQVKNLVYGNLPYEYPLQSRALIQSLPVMFKEYEVSIDIKPVGTVIGWSNILHVTAGGNYKEYGDRLPALFFAPNNHNLHICSAVSGNRNYCVDTVLRPGQYTRITVSQHFDITPGKYLYSVFVNGIELTSNVENKDPRTFTKVKAYLSDPYYPPSKVVLKNLRISTQQEDGGFKVVRGLEYRRIPRIERQWYLSFDVNPVAESNTNDYVGIIHVTRGGNVGQMGDRMPAVWFAPATTKLHICYGIGYNKDSCFTSAVSIKGNKFTNVRVRQMWNVASNKYELIININGIEVHRVFNPAARDFEDMLIYASDPWYTAADAIVRNIVFKNLPNGYSYADCLIERSSASLNCDASKSTDAFRTVTGVCNNLNNPTWGSSETPLMRIVAPEYSSDDKQDTPRGFPGQKPLLPPPNAVSKELFTVERTDAGNSKLLTTLFMTFGQFLDHDVTLTPHSSCKHSCNTTNAWQYPCFPLLFNTNTSKCSLNGRSKAVCTNKAYITPRQQRNDLSAFVDGSQIYSNDLQIYSALQDTKDGLMKITANGLLPVSKPESDPTCFTKGGCSLAGDVRADENIALHAMHTLWLRNHNRIARGLKAQNPTWDNSQLFDNARKINSALFQHITYSEYVPLLATLPKYNGYKIDANPSITNTFATAAFRYGHSLIPNAFAQLDTGFNKATDPVSLQEAFFNRQIINNKGIGPTLRGLVGNMSNNVDDGFAQAVARKLFVAVGATGYLDLTALNIQRGRDHGLPGYTVYRKYCKLSNPKTWKEVETIMLPDVAAKFQQIYQRPEEIDLFAGGISEKHVSGLEIGPTFKCLVEEQFTSLRDGDRFYYENTGVFTAPQLAAIRKVTMSTVLCENLNSDLQQDLISIQPSAFYTPSAIGNTRKTCAGAEIPKLDLSPWKQGSTATNEVKNDLDIEESQIDNDLPKGSNHADTVKKQHSTKRLLHQLDNILSNRKSEKALGGKYQHQHHQPKDENQQSKEGFRSMTAHHKKMEKDSMQQLADYIRSRNMLNEEDYENEDDFLDEKEEDNERRKIEEDVESERDEEEDFINDF